MRRPLIVPLAALATVGLLAGCTAGAPQNTAPDSSPVTEVETPPAGVVPDGTPADVATGLDVPWSVVFVGDETLVSERDTTEILAFGPGESPRSIGTVPGVQPHADGGLMGLAVREDEQTWIYAYYSTASDNRIVRMPYDDGSLGDPEIVVEGLAGGRGHNGGRIAFGPDGMLYATVGDSQNSDLSQDPAALGGKILRMTPEGDAPDDNPFPGSLVYSLGHRNPQGITWDEDGQLWAAEFGQDTWDELNRIEPGGNYGWPVVEGQAGDPDYIDPVAQWGTAESSPSGLAYIDGTFFLAALRGERVWSVTFDESGTAVSTSHYVGEYGRIRDVLPGPDGTLWFVTNNTDGRGDAPRSGDDRILSVPLASAEGGE